LARYIGVDGCRAGWIAVTQHGDQLTFRIFGAMRELLDAYPEAELVLVDIPIGLPWRGCPTRPCDAEARKLLGSPRASSVFPSPSRTAAHAETVDAARANNVSELERSLSAQAWGICKKIAEVDELLLSDGRARDVIREMHPEVCFWAFNGRQPMLHSKRTKDGGKERLSLLARHEPQTIALIARFLAQVIRKDAQPDDLLDALVAHITARAHPTSIRAVTGRLSHDARGLPMEMLYRGADAGRPGPAGRLQADY
jgi:predicted RNase H-like nuclease